MSPADFVAWQARLGLTLGQAACVLDVSRRTVTTYRTGPKAVPFAVELACRWIEDHPGLAGALAPERCQHRRV